MANKYTLREIKEKFRKKKKAAVTDVALGLNGIPTPETPMELDPLMRRTNNFASFPNNNVANNGWTIQVWSVSCKNVSNKPKRTHGINRGTNRVSKYVLII